jgi:hypothetical protein
MSWLSDKLFGKKKTLDINKIKEYMAPTQGLIDEQIGLGRLMMDPNSRHNQMMREMMRQRFMQSASQTGAQTGQQMTSNYMQNTYGQGVGLLGNMIGAQQGLDENFANAYMQNINAHNQEIANRKSQLMGLAGAAMSFGSSFIPKPIANTFNINTETGTAGS